MAPELRTFPNAAGAAEACAGHIFHALSSALAGNGQASLAVSGGSTPKVLFAAMARAVFDWKNVHVFLVDERAVPPDHEESNYRMVDEHLLRPCRIRNVHRIPTELTPEQAAKRYSADIREHFRIGDGELPHFDALHLGIGSDAHTASLFPGEPLIGDRQGIAAAVYVRKIPQWRITLLPGVLLGAWNLVVLASGEDKKQALDAILNGPLSPQEFPAQIVAREARRPVFFLDEAAVGFETKASGPA
jgi:6-phosphogluconolactonase